MIGIGAIIGIAASVIQTVQAANREDSSTQRIDRLFSQLDASGNGSIQSSDLQSAFEQVAATATAKADQLFAQLDANSDGRVTKDEFSGSINRLAEQLDQQHMRLRMFGENANNVSFTQNDLSNLSANLASNFEKADADGDGKVNLQEAINFGRTNPTGTAAPSTTVPAGGSPNVDLMLQVMRLMQAYGTNQSRNEISTNSDGGNNRNSKVSVTA